MPRLNKAVDLFNADPLEEWKYALRGALSLLDTEDQLQLLGRLTRERGFSLKKTQLPADNLEAFLDSIHDEKGKLDLRWVPGWRCIVDDRRNKHQAAWNR